MGFKLTIVAPDKVLYEQDDVNFVILPGELGQLGILKRHTPLLSVLRAGKIAVKEKGKDKGFDIGGGFVEVLPDRVTVLASFQKTQIPKDNEEGF